MSSRSCLAGIVLMLLASGNPSHAQKHTARMFGIVVDARTGAALAGAEVIAMADGRVVTSDSTGYYVIDKLPTGIVKFMVRAARYPVTTVVVALTPGEQFERVIAMDSLAASPAVTSQNLPEVTVRAAPSLGPRYADFERRIRTGRGQYITRAQIEQAGFSTIPDAMRGLRGVLLDCGGGLGCSVRMASAPMRCAPDYVVDERIDNFFGPNTPIRDIEGIEVYTGPSQLPGELAGRNSGCGLIVIWTRSGPPRAKKR